MNSQKQVINTSIFRKNDIRGRVPEDLNIETGNIIGKAFAQYVLSNTGNNPGDTWVSIGYDARTHSPDIADALMKGITSIGVNVINLERCPTPVVYFSNFFENNDYITPDASIMITGSHNPSEYNGLKMNLGVDCLKSDDIQQIMNIALNAGFDESSKSGKIIHYDLVRHYIKYILDNFLSINSYNIDLKVVIDSGNGCAGEIVPDLLRQLGCEVIELYSEPDGNFPNHHPDPTVIENLEELINQVKLNQADLGIAYDGDVDRIGVVDSMGNVIPGDMLMLIFCIDIISQNKYKNPVFISEVKCSQVLYDEITKLGGNIIMWKTGHSFIKDKMKQENALLAGEMSGHIFFADKYYGYDDAIYATCRLIEFIVKSKSVDRSFSLNNYLSTFPKMSSTPEIRIKCPDEIKFDLIESLKNKIFELKSSMKDINDIITIDGLRIVYNNGFSLVRASNTEPILVTRHEAITEKIMLEYKTFLTNLIEESLKKFK